MRKDIHQIVHKWLADTNSEGLTMITALIISCIRGVHYSSNKIEALDILNELSRYTPNSDIVLERIVPFIVSIYFYIVKDIIKCRRLQERILLIEMTLKVYVNKSPISLCVHLSICVF